MTARDSRPMANPSPLQCLTRDQERTMYGFILQRGGSPRGLLSDRKTFGRYGLRTERRSRTASVRTARIRFGVGLSTGASLKRLCITPKLCTNHPSSEVRPGIQTLLPSVRILIASDFVSSL